MAGKHSYASRQCSNLLARCARLLYLQRLCISGSGPAFPGARFCSGQTTCDVAVEQEGPGLDQELYSWEVRTLLLRLLL